MVVKIFAKDAEFYRRALHPKVHEATVRAWHIEIAKRARHGPWLEREGAVRVYTINVSLTINVVPKAVHPQGGKDPFGIVDQWTKCFKFRVIPVGTH